MNLNRISLFNFFIYTVLSFDGALAEVQTCAFSFSSSPTSESVQSTAELQRQYLKIEQKVYWGTGIETEMDPKRLVAPESLHQVTSAGLPGSEAYGRKVFRSWRRGESYLRSIPIGNFKISKELIQEVYRQVAPGLNPTAQFFSRWLPKGTFPDMAGNFKSWSTFARDPLLHSLSEEAYQNIQNNPWLGGFYEFPFPISRPGHRRGLLFYGRAADLHQKLNSLIEWYSANRNSLDPIELAAIFQRRMSSIHPLVDGNGRVSRLLMERILAEYRLPPPLLENFNDDLYVSEKEYVQKVRKGVALFIQQAKTAKFRGAKTTQLLRLSERPEELATKYPKAFEFMSPPILNEIENKIREVRIGSERFIVGEDGFFYNRYGIPHVLQNKQLYPISERSVWLYEMRFTAKAEELSPAKYLLLESHMSFLENILSNPDIGHNTKVTAYAGAIREQNQKGEYYIYPWQKNLIESLAKEMKIPAAARLATLPKAVTEYENKLHFSNEPPPVPLVLAQYERMDLQFYQLGKYLQKTYPELSASIFRIRKALHQAARELLIPYWEAQTKMTTVQRSEFQSLPQVQLFNTFLEQSFLKFTSLEEALKTNHGRETIPLLRADITLARIFGYVPQGKWRQFLNLIPFNSTLAKQFTKIDTSNFPQALSRLIQLYTSTTLSSTYSIQSISEEMDRPFINQAIHALGISNERMANSFSTNTSLYEIFSVRDLPFVAPEFNGSLFILLASKDEVDWNFGNRYFSNEYEILSRKFIGPQRTKNRFAIPQLLPRSTPSSPFIVAQFEKFFSSQHAKVFEAKPVETPTSISVPAPFGNIEFIFDIPTVTPVKIGEPLEIEKLGH